MAHLLYSLLPTFLVFLVVIFTKRLPLALMLGSLLGALLATSGSIPASLKLLVRRLREAADLDSLFLYGFLFVLGILITLIEHSGGIAWCAQWLLTKLKSKRSAELISMALSCSLSLDDYLSVLTTGAIMRPITDTMGIARVKLAWLIHSLSGPIVILAPLSSWLVMITSQLEQAGAKSSISPDTKLLIDPYLLFLKSTPFILYSILTFASVFIIVWFKISYGSMHIHEMNAQKTGTMRGNTKEIETTNSNHTPPTSLIHLIAPLLALMITFIAGIAYNGGYDLLGGNNGFIAALKSTHHVSYILFASSVVATLVSILLRMLDQRTRTYSLIRLAQFGVHIMAWSVLIVLLASIFGAITRLDLHSGTYLAQAFSRTMQPWLLPLATFAISTLAALTTGSAWGTIALLVPLALQMTLSLSAVAGIATLDDVRLLLPVLGAVFSGAACGNHISPIAETSTMSATSAGCSLFDHVKTQVWYAIPAIIGTAAGFCVIGFLLLIYQMSLAIALGIAMGVGLVVTILSILLFSLFLKHD